MKQEIKTVLDKIEENGFEAYVVGGYVRDYCLHIETYDIDVCTNALPKDILKIFGIKKDISSYGSVQIINDKYNFDITTYRKESQYVGRKPQSIEYTNNLLEDINRRDFTINSLCMNSNGQIFDYLNVMDDIKHRRIRVIGDTYEKLSEDPLRILRAVRFAIVLDFKLDKEIIDFIQKNKDLISSLSYTRKKEELDKIFSSKNIVKGYNLLKDLDLLSILEIKCDRIVPVRDLMGIWAQLDFSPNYPFTKSNLNIINKIRNILEYNKIDNYILFREGLYISSVAGEIMNYNKKDINQMFSALVIHNKDELAIKSKDIIGILGINPSNQIKVIYDDILHQVLDHNIKNDFDSIKKYIIDNWK